ncbi:DNA primase family protein [Limosilactobacillus reuteri]|uniref:DNA primase family protein n=1 Tax=Limosilactobacillus reuteri TaxID=1598 RepID=UPI001E4C6089|nr:phage/plasmid primase, P4 family [Limosilactobacillus reuteri]MCC4482468.1 phage/plasmid primase, P4 family [Limosilactobacillus reuteri]
MSNISIQNSTSEDVQAERAAKNENVSNRPQLSSKCKKAITITDDTSSNDIVKAARLFCDGKVYITSNLQIDNPKLEEWREYVSAIKATRRHNEEQKEDKEPDLKELFGDDEKPGIDTMTLTVGGLKTSWEYQYKDFGPFEADFSQIGAAYRLTKACKNNIAYDVDRGAWRAWNGQRWVWINSTFSQLTQLVREIVEEMQWEVNVKLSDGSNQQKAARRSVTQLKNQPKLIQVLKIAQSEDLLGVSNVTYNSENDLINCINGEINIKTGELIKHNKYHLFTKVIPFRYDPKAKSKLWEQFLSTTFENNQDMINYFQLAIGDSALNGVNTDRHLYVLFGNGRDGKSVAMGVIRHVLGGDATDGSGFADTADIQTFLKKRSGGGASASPDLANLDGVRLVTPTEPSKDAQLDEGMVKSITGKSDTMKVRNLYSSPFTLNSQFSLWIAANDIPKSSASQAIMDRLIIIPFSHRIRPNSPEDIPNLDKQLEESKNAEAVLAWLVEGSVKASHHRAKTAKEAAEARKNGQLDKVIYQDPLMPYPEPVKRARNKYQYSANSSLSFIMDTLYNQSEAMNIIIQQFLTSNNTMTLLSQGVSDRLKGDDISIWDNKFNEIRLVFDKSAYISKSDLYRMYKSWCDSEGINHPASKKSFHDSLSTVLPESKQRGVRVWLGIGVLPWIEKRFGTDNSFNVGNYRGFLKDVVRRQNNGNLSNLANRGYIFLSDDKTTDNGRDNIEKFINLNPSSFANKQNDDFNSIDWDYDVLTSTTTNFHQMFSKNTNNTTNQPTQTTAQDSADGNKLTVAKANEILGDPNATEKQQADALNVIFDD